MTEIFVPTTLFLNICDVFAIAISLKYRARHDVQHTERAPFVLLVFRAHWRSQRYQRHEVPIDEVVLRAAVRDETGAADLDRLLGVLNREEQVIMTPSYAYGLTNTEVGEILEMPAGTIKARHDQGKDSPRQGPDPRALRRPGLCVRGSRTRRM